MQNKCFILILLLGIQTFRNCVKPSLCLVKKRLVSRNSFHEHCVNPKDKKIYERKKTLSIYHIHTSAIFRDASFCFNLTLIHYFYCLGFNKIQIKINLNILAKVYLKVPFNELLNTIKKFYKLLLETDS